ncbi:MAG: hypothetical protein ABJL99_24400 [Aliishimia sp.]
MQAAVFWATDAATLTLLGDACTPRDAAYAATFDRHEDRLKRRATYGLVRHALKITGWAAETTLLARRDTGQPYLKHTPGLTISLSHASNGVAVGLGLECAVGVDIEADQEDAVWRDVLPFVTSAKNVSPQMGLCIWTLSEACAKSHGLGLPALEIAHLPLDIKHLQERQRIAWQCLAQRDVRCFNVGQGALAYAVSPDAKVISRRV